MKSIQIIAGVMAGALLALVLAGCGPTGGTLTLVNESSYLLSSPSISLGGGREGALSPGQWMQSSIDKNAVGATVEFSLAEGEDKITVSHGGSWFLARWTSNLIGVRDGEAVVVTVTNKSN